VDSPYQPGTLTRYWIKAPLNTTVKVVVAGWKPGGGHRAGMIGSLLLGMYDDAGRLTYAATSVPLRPATAGRTLPAAATTGPDHLTVRPARTA
jgi:hypothetical protein